MVPDAVQAALDLLRRLPRAIVDSLSGDTARVDRATSELTEVQTRLGAAGVEVGPKLGAFPARLAELRREFEVGRSPGSSSD